MKRILFVCILFVSSVYAGAASATTTYTDYAWVEQADGCGADSGEQPEWSDTTTTYTKIGDSIYWHYLSRGNIDSIRVGIRVGDGSLYENDAGNWWFAGDDQVWDASIDLAGSHHNYRQNFYYRGEEKNELCDEVYHSGTPYMMKVKWGYSYPGTQNTWIFKWPVLAP